MTFGGGSIKYDKFYMHCAFSCKFAALRDKICENKSKRDNNSVSKIISYFEQNLFSTLHAILILFTDVRINLH
jgi:hypothetical protein